MHSLGGENPSSVSTDVHPAYERDYSLTADTITDPIATEIEAAADIDVSHKKNRWLRRYEYLDPSNTDAYFSTTQEAALAGLIAAGTTAQETLDVIDNEMTPLEISELKTRIEEGKKARMALFEVNIPFALFCARESVGIIHTSTRRKLSQVATGRRLANKAPGTYKPLSRMQSPYADLDQRQQSALEGLWDATLKYVPGTAKFTTYASWGIQKRMQRDIENEEHNGIRLPNYRHSLLNNYNTNEPFEDNEEERNAREWRNSTDYIPFPDTLANRSEGSVGELNDPQGENDDFPDTLAEVWADNSQSVADRVADRLLVDEIDDLLGSLSEREAAVIRMRFGIGPDEAHRLYAVAKVLNVSEERIRQIESKALAKLRHPGRSDTLREYLLQDDESFVSSIQRGDDIVLPEESRDYHTAQRRELFPSPAEPLSEQQADKLESWQYFADERWNEPVRRNPEGYASGDELKKAAHILDTARSWHFDVRSEGRGSHLYSGTLMDTFTEALGGKSLSYFQLEQVWNVFMESGFVRLQEELGKNLSYARVGRMFSKFIESFTDDSQPDDKELTLRIPESASGRISYLASGLKSGNVKILGNVGPYVAERNGGRSSVTVRGNAGTDAGSWMQDDASLTVYGEVDGKPGLRAGVDTKILVSTISPLHSNLRW